MAGVKWFIVVQPPANCVEPFDIPEWSYELGCDTCCRYNMRGWKAVLMPGNAKKPPWSVRGRGLDEVQVIAKSREKGFEMEYVVEVISPMVGGAVFEVEEPDYVGACYRARRYRERGWGAAVSSATELPRWWHVWAPGNALPPMDVRCRSLDCALAVARRVDRGYCAAYPIEVGEEV